MRLICKNLSPFCKVVNKKFMTAYDKPSFAKLQNRSLFIVNGPQTRKLLQGIVTNNISQLYQSTANKKQPRIALYTLFMNPKGKIVSDAFIIRPLIYHKGVKRLVQDQLWIDVSKQTSTQLYEHLRKYTWKKNVQIVNLQLDETKPDIHVGFNKVIADSQQINKALQKIQQFSLKAGHALQIQSEQQIKQRQKRQSKTNVLQAKQKTSKKLQKTKQQIQDQDDEGDYANIAYFDPRGIKFGIRMICGANGFRYIGEVQKSTEKQYQKVCTLNGASKSISMVNKLPFMFNSDLFNGFSFNKGCYLGQQVVARAYYVGVVRRRIFPFILREQYKNKVIQVGETLYGENKQQIGKVIQSGQGYGTVLCNYLPFLEKPWPLKIQQPAKGSVNIPFQTQLRKYIQETKEKQAKLQQIDL